MMKLMLFVVVLTTTLCFVQSSQSIHILDPLMCALGKFICRPDQGYKLNDCQNCGCLPNGQGFAICTLLACVYPQGHDPRNCLVGTSWRENCNTCCCVKNLGTVCSANKCSEGINHVGW